MLKRGKEKGSRLAVSSGDNQEMESDAGSKLAKVKSAVLLRLCLRKSDKRQPFVATSSPLLLCFFGQCWRRGERGTINAGRSQSNRKTRSFYADQGGLRPSQSSSRLPALSEL
jgi:hypothetical protein